MKLYTAQITDNGEVFARMQIELRATAEHVISYYMDHAKKFTTQQDRLGFVTTFGEPNSNS